MAMTPAATVAAAMVSAMGVAPQGVAPAVAAYTILVQHLQDMITAGTVAVTGSTASGCSAGGASGTCSATGNLT